MRPITLIPLIALAACVQDAPVDGKLAFMDNCAACHGASGQGDGPLAANLTPTPPDLTRIAARNGGVFDRAYVASFIDGLDRGQHNADVMPEFGAGDLGPLVTTDEDGVPVPIPLKLLVLTDYVESIQQ
ncbi:cytochrome c [Yoonia sp. R2331]|uniref:c-type cytochrome n=1 Tax=Yoonia sp. R2331 TaxID=3237238 RepID=UPI0034E4622E